MSDKLQGGVFAGSVSTSLTAVFRALADSSEVTSVAVSSVVLSYWRQGAAVVTTATSTLPSVSSVWSVGGMVNADTVNQPGAMRVDWPDAAFATGSDWVQLAAKAPSCFVFYERLPLTTNVIQSSDGGGSSTVANNVTSIINYVSSIQAKTNNLPGDPASASTVAASVVNVSSIWTKTQNLGYTVPGFLDSNVQYVNDILVTGTGASSNTWGP